MLVNGATSMNIVDINFFVNLYDVSNSVADRNVIIYVLFHK